MRIALLLCVFCGCVATIGLAQQNGTSTADAQPPKSFFQDIPSAAFKFELVLIPGDESKNIKPFYIGKTELTWEAFDVFVYRLDETEDEREIEIDESKPDAITRPTKPYLPPDRGFGHDGYATISVTYHAADAFCKWLSAKSGRRYRLATEAEWQHAALAGVTTSYCFGDDPAQLDDYAWFADNANGTPHPVGKKRPNAWGVHDMHGNVAEWCKGEDGKPVTCGGSYRDPAQHVTARSRAKFEPSWNASDPQIPKSKWWLADGPFAGFRVVCEVDAQDTRQIKANDGK